MPHMEGIFINGEKAKFHPEDILDTDASQYTEEIGESVTAYLTEHLTNPSNPPIDTSLSIAGAAADAKETGDQISQLKSDFNHCFRVPFTWVDGHYIVKTSGNSASISGMSHTDYIQCDIYDLYALTNVSNDFSGLAFYDENYLYISGYSPFENNGILTKLDVPNNAKYVRITCLTAYKDAFIVYYANIGSISQNEISDLKPLQAYASKIIEKSGNLLPIYAKTTATAGVSVEYADGVFSISGTATGDGGRLTPTTANMLLEAGTYSFTCYTNRTYNPVFFLQVVDSSNYLAFVQHDNTSSFTITESTQCFVGVNVESGKTYNGEYNVQIEKGSSTPFTKPSDATAIDRVARNRTEGMNKFWSYAMSKILCIGDSLTSGANYTGSWSGASIDQNYPRILGRMLDAEVTNAGVSGITASGWYKDEISKYTLADYDAFIIWLGTNYGLTDTLDTEVNPYSDYNDYADTHTGNYCKIIEKIKADKPSSLVVLVKIFATSGSMGAKVANSVIDKIAQKYNLPVIDNSDLTSHIYPNLHGNINNPHFSKAGNIFLANRFVTVIGSIISDNPLLADFGETARTN